MIQLHVKSKDVAYDTIVEWIKEHDAESSVKLHKSKDEMFDMAYYYSPYVPLASGLAYDLEFEDEALAVEFRLAFDSVVIGESDGRHWQRVLDNMVKELKFDSKGFGVKINYDKKRDLNDKFDLKMDWSNLDWLKPDDDASI